MFNMFPLESQTLHSPFFCHFHHFHEFTRIFHPLKNTSVVQTHLNLIQMPLILLAPNWFKPILENHKKSKVSKSYFYMIFLLPFSFLFVFFSVVTLLNGKAEKTQKEKERGKRKSYKNMIWKP